MRTRKELDAAWDDAFDNACGGWTFDFMSLLKEERTYADRFAMARAIRWATNEAWIEPDQTGKYHDVMALADAIERGEVEIP